MDLPGTCGHRWAVSHGAELSNNTIEPIQVVEELEY